MARTIKVGDMVEEINANRNGQEVEYRAIPSKAANPKGRFLPKDRVSKEYGVYVNGTQVGVTNRRDIPAEKLAGLDAKSQEPEVTVGPTTTSPVGSGAPRKVGGELQGTTLPIRDALAALRSGTGGAFPEDAVRSRFHAKGPMDEDRMRMNAERLGFSEQQIASFEAANKQAKTDMMANAILGQDRPFPSAGVPDLQTVSDQFKHGGRYDHASPQQRVDLLRMGLQGKRAKRVGAGGLGETASDAVTPEQAQRISDFVQRQGEFGRTEEGFNKEWMENERGSVAMPAERMTPRMLDLIQGAVGNRLGDSDRDRAAQIYRRAEDIGRRESGGRQDWIGRGEEILRAQDRGQLKDLRPEDVGLTGGLARGGGNLDYLRMLKQINDKEIESNVSRHQSAMEAFADAPYGGKRVAKFREGLEDRRAAAIAASEAAGRRGLGDPRGKRFEHEQEMAMIESFNPTEFVKHAAELGQHFADEKIAGMYNTMLQGVNQLTQDMWAAKARGAPAKELVGHLHNIRGARQKMIAWALERLPQGSGKWDPLIAGMQREQEGPDPRL